MGKIGTGHQQRAVQEGQPDLVEHHQAAPSSYPSWWQLPLSRKVAHFEYIIDSLSASAARVTQRPAREVLMGARKRGREGARAKSAPAATHPAHGRSLWKTDDWGSVLEEGERRRRKLRRRRARGKRAFVDPTHWPFEVKVGHFSDIALEQRLKHEIEEAWRAEKRTRMANKSSQITKDGQNEKKTAKYDHEHQQQQRKEPAVEVESVMQSRGEARPEGEGASAEANRSDDAHHRVEESSGYVNQLQVLRSSDEGQKKRRSRKRKAARKSARAYPLKELEKQQNQGEEKGAEARDQNANDGEKGYNLGQQPSDRTMAKWERGIRGQVRKELSKLCAHKLVKRRRLPFERHLANREVFGKGAADAALILLDSRHSFMESHDCRVS